MDPVRILHIVGGMDRGGAETLIMELYRNIDREKIQFDFVMHTDDICQYSEEIRAMGGRIYSAPRYRGYNHFQYKNWWKDFLGHHEEYRVMHIHMQSTASIYLPMARQKGITTIAHSHNISNGYGVVAYYKNFLQRNVEKYADFCFACSKDAGQWLFPHRDFTVINNAVDSARFAFDPDVRIAVRKEWNIESCFVLGTVGRLTIQKNPEKILEIFGMVWTILPSARLLWVGDGELREEIQQQIRRRGKSFSEAVIMAGVRPDVERLLQAMDVFIFPSLWEGLGISVVEAQAAGLPCVISDKVPNESIVTEGLVTVKKLSDPAEKWTKCILEKSYIQRRNTESEIKAHGYDIRETAQWIQQFYQKYP